MSKSFYVYILLTETNTLYCGYTDDVERRFLLHQSGKGAKYTRSRLPVSLVYQESVLSRGEALRREAAIKRLTRAQKLSLIKNGGD